METTFIKETENFIYKEIAKNTNKLFGKNKTASLSTGIFLKLPIEIRLEKVKEPLPRLYKDLKTFFPTYFSAHVEYKNSATVYFTFFYHSEKELKALTRDMHYRGMFYTFTYLHELQHILRKHNTVAYKTLMENIAKNTSNPHELANVAEDYAINYSLKDLFILAKMKSQWLEIEACVLYNSTYHTEKLSDIEILKKLVEDLPTISAQEENGWMKIEVEGKSFKEKIQEDAAEGDAEGEDTSKGTGGKDKTSTTIDDSDISKSDLADAIQDIITNSTKGTAAGDLIEELFNSIKVETGWFKKIKAAFKRQVYYKTHDYSTSWSNMNNTYRRIYKSPKKFFFDNKIDIILSVDHSGSMATTDLQKLLYLIESESTKISKLTVLIHDTRVVKTFTITDDYDITNSPDFIEALATRHVVGGTSHDDVFRTIEEMKIVDRDKVIYMSFSDNQSDIEQTIGKYPIMQKLTKYWICAGINKPVKTSGTNIFMV